MGKIFKIYILDHFSPVALVTNPVLTIFAFVILSSGHGILHSPFLGWNVQTEILTGAAVAHVLYHIFFLSWSYPERHFKFYVELFFTILVILCLGTILITEENAICAALLTIVQFPLMWKELCNVTTEDIFPFMRRCFVSVWFLSSILCSLVNPVVWLFMAWSKQNPSEVLSQFSLITFGISLPVILFQNNTFLFLFIIDKY